jgi:multiple sugar transport system ATP-binding protein
MAVVELNNVTKIYEENKKAVDNATLTVKDGEFVVLVGPSGCGKSTLLRMIAGLEDITEGTIKIGVNIVNRIASKDRNIAMVFQNYALYPHMTVYGNIAFGLKLRKYDKNEIKKRVTEAAEILDLTEYLNKKPKQLSGGQRQRVAVGRAIVRKPDVFLFDEPLSNLDAKLRVQMRLEISKLHKKLGTTMLYVTHDQMEAMTMADRIVVMYNGIIQQIDTPLETYNNPENKFVASFIGSPSMNFFEGEIINDSGLSFKSAEIEQKIDNEFSERLRSCHNKKLILGIRPEDIKILNKTNDRKIYFEAGVEIIEPLGNELFVHCIVGSVNFILRCNTDTLLTIGQKINLSIDFNKAHFFDKNSGNRI